MLLIVIFILNAGQPISIELGLFPDRQLCQQAKVALEKSVPAEHGQGRRFECVEP